MHWPAYVLPLLLPVAAALAARPLGDRLPPRAATWLLAGGALVLAASSSAALALLALDAALRIPFVAGLAHLPAGVASRSSPALGLIAVIAGTVLLVAVFAVLRALRHRIGAVAAAGRRARALPGAGQVVVTDDEAADAYTLPGWPGRIVITSGMLHALTGPERQVLVAHERTHAAGRHYLFTAAARVAAAANPLLRPVAAAVGYTAERWADEHAAAAAGDRRLAATAVARAALAAQAARPGSRSPAAALGIAGRTGPGPGPVPRRVAALLVPPPRLRLPLVAGVVLLVLLSVTSTLDAAWAVHQFVEYAQG
ncbi:MAG TPA: M48 family metalloprotease [Trebonia sp.]